MNLTSAEKATLAPLYARFTNDAARRIDCGPGWISLLLACDAELAAIDANYRLVQVKEKFAGLRYYFDSSIEDAQHVMRSIARQYEIQSNTVCEKCGEPGIHRNSRAGRMQTLCLSDYNPEHSTT